MEVLTTRRTPGPGTRRRNWRPALLVLPFLIFSGATEMCAQNGSMREYLLKAVFLFNFAQFVEWPETAFEREDSPIVIGILGDDPFGAHLDETVRGEVVGARALEVRRYRRVEDALGCHILFISRTESERLEFVLGRLRGRHILTVSDTEGFALRGVMIRFANVNNRIKLRINLDAARAAGLTISSKLLRPAEIITTGGQ